MCPETMFPRQAESYHSIPCRSISMPGDRGLEGAHVRRRGITMLSLARRHSQCTAGLRPTGWEASPRGRAGEAASRGGTRPWTLGTGARCPLRGPCELRCCVNMDEGTSSDPPRDGLTLAESRDVEIHGRDIRSAQQAECFNLTHPPLLSSF